MRGKIDLADHKLAGMFRLPLHRTRMEKQPDEAYRQIWRIVNGATRDAFNKHPEYLSKAGRDAAVRSVTKRVTGAFHGYVTQVAQSRSSCNKEAADQADSLLGDVSEPARCKFASWMAFAKNVIRRWCEPTRTTASSFGDHNG